MSVYLNLRFVYCKIHHSAAQDTGTLLFRLQVRRPGCATRTMAPVVVDLFERRTDVAMLGCDARRWRARSGLGLP